MRIRILTYERIKDPSLKEIFDEYLRRIKGFTGIEVLRVGAPKGVGEYIKDKDFVIALDSNGTDLDSVEFSDLVKKHGLTKNLVFIVGGPEGLKDSTLEKADIAISLSRMTFTSQMAQVILIEQIYRACTLIKGINYHK